MKQKGFSLIELLVVLAIISAVLAILLPAFRLGRDQSRLIICASNLRQNHLLLSAYADDNNGFWPRTDSPYHTNQFHSSTVKSPLYYLWLKGYIQQPQTWYCPAGSDSFKKNWNYADGKLRPNDNALCGYQYRMFFAYYWPDPATTLTKLRQRPADIGYIKPSLHKRMAVYVDTFSYKKPHSTSNHSGIDITNVLFSDATIIRRIDNGTMRNLDLSWNQAGDWRIPLANGQPDTTHNVAFLWHFFDKGTWPSQLPVR